MKNINITQNQILIGPLFNEPMRVITVQPQGNEVLSLGLVGTQSEKFRNVNLKPEDLDTLQILDSFYSYDSDGKLIHLGLQAYRLGIAYEYDPYFGLSISRVDPLPHQLEAIYNYLLKTARVRFLLADDAGAGKTIMAGLLIRELKMRGLIKRILIVCPANLSFQWQREMKDKFDEKFQVMKGRDLREQYGVNQWMEKDQVITSLDLAKRDEILPSLKQVSWDLVIIDEAHRMSARDESHKSLRYKLGELLRDISDHILLMTATPHKGDPNNFTLFLQLLDPDVYADVKSIKTAMEKRKAPFYLRRVKEAMVYFPEKQKDGSWVAKKIFTERIPNTVGFKIDGDEFELYKTISQFIKRQSARAAAAEDDPRARAVGFLMSLYQRRLASSTHSLRKSLENRANRLENLLTRAEELKQVAPPDLPTPEEMEEMEDFEREHFEQILEAITISNNADEIKLEIEELREFAIHAKTVEDSGTEAKLAKLKSLLQKEGFYEDHTQRLLIFTEYKDTLKYLEKNLSDWGFKVGCIHGSMRPGSRDEVGSRIFVEQQFWQNDIQILLATEAAGEGINLHCCNIMFNYDIPWNPNRLEQRMGRIHRYGQKKDCLIFNFVATNTIEGRVLSKLLEKLQNIRDALEDDAVFNVIGEVLPANHVEKILRDYYSGKLGDQDLEDRILKDVDEDHFKAICQNALEGLATKKINLEMLVERKAKAQEKRIVPETIARFIYDSSELVNLRLKQVKKIPFTFDPNKTPSALLKYERQNDWRLPPIANKYPRFSTDRKTAENLNLEWVTPGHSLFESLRRHTVENAQEALSKGACFYSIQHATPSRIDFFRARVVDGLGEIIHERLFAVETTRNGDLKYQDPAILGNFSPAPFPDSLPDIPVEKNPVVWLSEHVLEPFLLEIKNDRVDEIERIKDHIELSLTELLGKIDLEIGLASEEIEFGVKGAQGRLSRAENRHAEISNRREQRKVELIQQGSLSLQAVDSITSVIILPHPDRETPEVRRMRPNPETEMIAMRVVMEYEESQGRIVEDIHEQNLGYDITSLDKETGEFRLIEIKGLQAETGTILLTPNEQRVAQDRPDCFWLYIVTNCGGDPVMQEPILNPARFPWHEVKKVQHYYLNVGAMTKPMQESDSRDKEGDET